MLSCIRIILSDGCYPATPLFFLSYAACTRQAKCYSSLGVY